MTNKQQIKKAEAWIGHIIRIGAFISAGVILFGWILSLQYIIMAGLLMLIFLPIMRVFAAAIIFIKQKDYVYVCLSLIVLTVLITSLVLGKHL